MATITRWLNGDFGPAQADALHRELESLPEGDAPVRIEIGNSFVATLSTMNLLRHSVAPAVQRKIPVELACPSPLATGFRRAGLHLICDLATPADR